MYFCCHLFCSMLTQEILRFFTETIRLHALVEVTRYRSPEREDRRILQILRSLPARLTSRIGVVKSLVEPYGFSYFRGAEFSSGNCRSTWCEPIDSRISTATFSSTINGSMPNSLPVRSRPFSPTSKTPVLTPNRKMETGVLSIHFWLTLKRNSFKLFTFLNLSRTCSSLALNSEEICVLV